MEEENSNYKFTILGETGSGKTCYLLGMYYEMAMGVAGYNLVTKNPDDDKNLTLRYEILNDKKRGKSRFPDPSDVMQKYIFRLQYAYQTILSFEWIDYPGGWLDPKIKDTNTAQYQEVAKNISESSALFICIDGANLLGNNTNKKIRAVKTKCARNINSYLGEFEGRLPPIAMIVTKYDLCENDTNADEVKEILEESFESLFVRDNVFVSIIPVSLGATLQDDSYSGDLEPLNIHLPILMGMDFALVDKLHEGKEIIESQTSDIEQKKRWKEDEEDSFFLWRDDDYINRLENEIKELETFKENNLQLARYFKKSLNRVNRDLEEVEMIFRNGTWQDRRNIRLMWDNLHSIADWF